jgi:sterol desaturase/sphingolipid hydroxylase (fatty acid hydroxylase superfamily)
MNAIVYFAIPGFILAMLLELWLCRRRGLPGYETRDSAASLAMGLGNVFVAVATQAVIAGPLFYWAWQHRLTDLGAGPVAFVASLVATDFVYYWWHRASHEVRILWAAHENHHSSERFNLSTALRQSWTTPFTTIPFYILLPLVGFHPLLVLTQSSISLVYQFWIHTETIDRMPSWFEAVMNTPSHHRVHHGSNVEYLDRNHAGIFIVWDRWFGTFEPERAPVRYGLTKNIGTFNPIRIAFQEGVTMLRQAWRAPSLSAAAGYLLAPPGWSPDGSTLTADQLRAALAPMAEPRKLAEPRKRQGAVAIR